MERQTAKVVQSEVEARRQEKRCQDDEEPLELSPLTKAKKQYYGGQPKDIELAADPDLSFPENSLIEQSRSQTVWSERQSKPIVKPGKRIKS